MKALMLQTTGNCNAFFSQVLLFVMCKSSFTQHVCDRPEKLFLSLAICADMYHLATRRIADVCVCVCACGVVCDVVCLSWASLVLNVLYGRYVLACNVLYHLHHSLLFMILL